MLTRAVGSVVLALILVGALVELSSVAGGRHQSGRGQPVGLVTDVLEPDPPTGSELDDDDASEVATSPTLTR